MKPRNYQSVDGFRPRRRLSPPPRVNDDAIPARFLEDAAASDSDTSSTPPFTPTRQSVVVPTPSLAEPAAPAPVARPLPTPAKKPAWYRRLRKKLILRIIAIIIVLVIAVAGFLAIKAFIISGKLFNGGSVLSLLTPGTPLKTDTQGRTNILVFGTSQDDSAHQNAEDGGGLWLTDSIQLVSIDQKAKSVKLIAIPRDLWVKLDNCEIGDYAKINSVYECGSGLYNSSASTGPDYKKQDTAGAQALMTTIQAVTGVQPQYFAHVDYSVLRQATDAVGGIDVNIVGDGANGIYDTNFDWDCPNGPRTCKNVYYPHNGTYHLSGQQALYLARARADSGTYSYLDFGLAQGDFDRQANQQKIMIALKNKAESAGVLANPVALSKLLDALGDNVTTSFSAGEVKTLLDFSKKLPSGNIKSISLVDEQNPAVTTDMVSGQSVVVPTSGTYDYSSIINYIMLKLSSNPATAEGATIGVYNASEISGRAGKLQTKLQQAGLAVDTTGNADPSDAGSGTYSLYDLSAGKKPLTLRALQSQLGVTPTTGDVPADISSSDDFVIIINQ